MMVFKSESNKKISGLILDHFGSNRGNLFLVVMILLALWVGGFLYLSFLSAPFGRKVVHSML